MKPKYYILTKKGTEETFNDNFYNYFPEDIIIIDLLRIQPRNIRQIKQACEKIINDRFNRKVHKNIRSCEYFSNRIKYLQKEKFIRK